MHLLGVEAPGPARFDTVLQAWVLTRYEDVKAALRDCRFRGGSEGDWHGLYRHAAMDAFSGTKVETWRTRIEQEALELCGGLRSKTTLDVLHDFANPWSAAVAAIVTGDASAAARSCARAVFSAAAEPFDAALQTEGNFATQQLAAMFPCELAPLHVQAFVAICESLPAFLGNACYALLRHHRWGQPVDNVEELLRYAGPSKAQLRRAEEHVQIGGASVKAGEQVILMLASANRDPSVFTNPAELDLTRSPNPHLAFGAGAHSCLGGALVRLASSVALQALSDTFPKLTLRSVRLKYAFALRAIECLEASPSTTPHPVPR